MPQKRVPTITRYLAKVERSEEPDGCWVWIGAKDYDGYGIFWDGTYTGSGRGRYVRATRWTYEQFVGPMGAGQNVLHACDNPPCVNPAHLHLGSHADNHAEREARGRGRRCHGSTHVEAKLTEADVRTMRQAHDEGASLGDLAARFHVSKPLVHGIVHRRRWTHI